MVIISDGGTLHKTSPFLHNVNIFKFCEKDEKKLYLVINNTLNDSFIKLLFTLKLHSRKKRKKKIYVANLINL